VQSLHFDGSDDQIDTSLHWRVNPTVSTSTSRQVLGHSIGYNNEYLMSWLDDATNPDAPLKPKKKYVDDGPKVKDVSGRMVSTKTANQPFLK
jgi:hypothetical protein